MKAPWRKAPVEPRDILDKFRRAAGRTRTGVDDGRITVDVFEYGEQITDRLVSVYVEFEAGVIVGGEYVVDMGSGWHRRCQFEAGGE